MNIYIICPVRNAPEDVIREIRAYADMQRALGREVHFPPDDVEQSDPTGLEICKQHRSAMLAADEVHVYWDVGSKGSHFDLGMAFALRKKIVPVACLCPDSPGKSYWKVICS